MGWSVPEVPARAPATAWSPWVCLFIILFGVFIGLAWAMFSAPAGGLSFPSSGLWLPLTGYMLVSIMAAITVYLLWWEGLALGSYYWNSWRLNMRAAWQRQAHQYLCVASQVILTPDPQCIPQLIGLASSDDSENKPTTLLPAESLIPGISRFEKLCQTLITQATASLARWYPVGPITVVIQTSADIPEQQQRITEIWQQQALPWSATIEVLPAVFPFEYWNNQLLATSHPVLVLALHYRQPDETQAEFASALLLAPASLLSVVEQRDAVRLFRAMPLKISKLTAELKELRDMAQQPAEAVRLVWFSGLTAPQSQRLTTATYDLSLSLCSSAPMAGVIDFDKGSERYGYLAAWLMISAATEAVNYDMGSHWLVWADDQQAWAMAAGSQTPVPDHEPEIAQAAPFPAGGMMLAILLNALLLWFLASSYPTGLFSWWGTTCVLLVLGITLPGIALIVRKIASRLLLPEFIRAAGEHERNVE
ncbi:hypothetical protein [Pectobacterium odoriferum]|uniref:hypothetical protein n=1 Tax=Pectobacterium odoriferum TaxID=78398 RepID=UPI0015DE0536|nr:hypothetical protein [Pectobacterium odoriferum]MBA0190692.1 hypothetical protein [Pectobacterium odoriferum]